MLVNKWRIFEEDSIAKSYYYKNLSDKKEKNQDHAPANNAKKKA